MSRILLHKRELAIVDVLSKRFPFIVFRTKDTLGRIVIAKTIYPADLTTGADELPFTTSSSPDLMTSCWYGHSAHAFPALEMDELLSTHGNYLLDSSYAYNLENAQLERDINGSLYLTYDHIAGKNLSEKHSPDPELFIRIIPSLLKAVANFPHGDLRFDHIILHENGKRFSLIDPSSFLKGYFFTNTAYYPIVPPLYYRPLAGYATYPDQLAIGLMLYHLLTGQNPLSVFAKQPYWAKEFGSEVPPYISLFELYPFLTTMPAWEKSQVFKDGEYAASIKHHLIDKRITSMWFEPETNHRYADFPAEFFDIPAPKEINKSVPSTISELCMRLIHTYEPIAHYTDLIEKGMS